MADKIAQWITFPKEMQAPIAFKTFVLKDFKRIDINISGLGFYILQINGRRIDDGFFRPRVSNYCARDLKQNFVLPIFHEMPSLVYVDSFDVTKFFHKGENTITVMLGNGYFRNEGRLCEGDYCFADALQLFFDICITKEEGVEHIVSDDDTSYVSGYIIQNQLHTGEVHDYSLYDDGLFFGKATKQTVKKAEISSFSPQMKISNCPPDRVVERIKPKLIAVQNGKKLYDVGANITGWVRICAKACERVHVRYAEALKDNGELDDTLNIGNSAPLYECTFLHLQGKEELIPQFSWAGFQYFEIEGEYENIEVEFVTQLTEDLTEFLCDDEVLNWLYDAYKRSQKGNIHAGIPMDCPHRERYGYTGDGQLIAETALLYFSCENIMAGWCKEIANTQDPATGKIYNTAPYMGGGGGPGGWGGAIIFVPYDLYQATGKIKYLQEYFKNMQAYLMYMKNLAKDGIVKKVPNDKSCFLGDWSLPKKIEITPEFVNTYFYILAMQKFEEICEILNKPQELLIWSTERKSVVLAFKNEYYDAKSGSYLGGIQGADAYALRLGLGTEKTRKNLVEKYERLGQFDTGCFGTEILIGTLFKEGYAPLAYRLLTSTKENSFGAWKNSGATTLWETWSGDMLWGNTASKNHVFFGAVAKYIFSEILGIHRKKVGGTEFIISPKLLGKNGVRRGSLIIPCCGKISVEVVEEDGKLFTKTTSEGAVSLFVDSKGI